MALKFREVPIESDTPETLAAELVDAKYLFEIQKSSIIERTELRVKALQELQAELAIEKSQLTKILEDA